MIKLAVQPKRHSLTRPPNTSREEAPNFKVSWITQQTHREAIDEVKDMRPASNLRDNSHLGHLKLCLKKEINLIPAQNIDSVQPAQRTTLLQESPAANSYKNSCQKRNKLSLFSKRPSLRKINDFISFKEERKEEKENRSEEGKEKESAVVKEGEGRKEGKRCIRISSRRHGLAEINKI